MWKTLGGLMAVALASGVTVKPVSTPPPVAGVVAPSPYPCQQEKESSQLDFWIGSWRVEASGMPAAESHIEALPGGCLIVESFTVGGYAGRSMSFFDPQLGKWRQVWVDNGGRVAWFQGEEKDGAMVFEGESYRRDGVKRHSKMTFTRLADGSVRQHVEVTQDGGKTWTTAFDGHYVRRQS